jgi:hypothetical protein
MSAAVQKSESIKRNAVAVALAVLLAFSQIAKAQEPPPSEFPEFSTYDLFEGDDPHPLPHVLQQVAGAIRHALPPGDCLLGRLRIRTPEGDPIFQSAMAGARRDTVMAAPHHRLLQRRPSSHR